MKPYSRYYRCLNFDIRELVDPVTYKLLGESGCWALFDPLLLSTMDRLRQRHNAVIIVNNWASGGGFQFRGYRPPDCKTGADYSGHKRGQCIDFDVTGKAAEEVRKDILENPDHIDHMFINAIESKVNWVHISTSNYSQRIKIIVPRDIK